MHKRNVIAIILTALIFIAAALLGVSSVYRVSAVTLDVSVISEAAKGEADELQRKLAERYRDESIFFVEKQEAEEEFAAFPYFRMVSFKKTYPNRLVIQANEDAELFAVDRGNGYYILGGRRQYRRYGIVRLRGKGGTPRRGRKYFLSPYALLDGVLAARRIEEQRPFDRGDKAHLRRKRRQFLSVHAGGRKGICAQSPKFDGEKSLGFRFSLSFFEKRGKTGGQDRGDGRCAQSRRGARFLFQKIEKRKKSPFETRRSPRFFTLFFLNSLTLFHK